MKKRGIFKYAGFCFMLLLLIVSEGSASWEDYEITKYSFDISATPRQEWYPSISYNPIDNEFLLLWHTSGKLRDDCVPGDEYECITDFHTVHGQRVSPDGVLLGAPFQLSPPEEGWKTLPKSAYNIYRNEYMVSFSAGDEFLGQEIYIMRIDNEGNIIDVPALLPIPQYAVSHPGIRFNSAEQEYLVVLNDTLPTSSEEQAIDNFSVILNADGGLVSGPTVVGSTPGWQFNPQLIYNSVDNTHLVVWEDFRHVEWILDNCDLYGALLDTDGNTIGSELPVIDDFGMPDEGSQQNQYIAYNPDMNEFLVSWGADEQPSLDAWGDIVGRILNGDGTPKGDPFVICDAPKPQHSSQAIYVQKEQKYFIVWADSRNDTKMQPGEPFYMSSQVDIYGKWLEPSGAASGPDVPICTEEGVQAWPTLAYSPAKDRLLIAWHDLNAPDDYDIIEGGGGGMVFPMPSNVRGTLYGVPPPALLNIGDQWANCGDVGVKIPICLINLEVEVGAVQVDLCEDIDDCLICVGCEMTERTTIFDCMVNELENGCCALVVFSKNPGGVINPGECDIVIIDYTIKDESQCCDNCIGIDGENLEVVDQYGYLVDSLVSYNGMVCPFECGDVEPAASTAASWDCGDGDVDIFDILEEVDFIIHVKIPDNCQLVRADTPTGTPPNCDPPDGAIDVGDLMVIIDMALNRQDCCSYYYGGVIY